MKGLNTQIGMRSFCSGSLLTQAEVWWTQGWLLEDGWAVAASMDRRASEPWLWSWQPLGLAEFPYLKVTGFRPQPLGWPAGPGEESCLSLTLPSPWLLEVGVIILPHGTTGEQQSWELGGSGLRDRCGMGQYSPWFYNRIVPNPAVLHCLLRAL